MKRLIPKFILLYLIVQASFLSFVSTAFAVSSVFPDTGDPNHMSVVAKSGNGIGLDADISNYKVYTTLNDADSGTSELIIEDFCYRSSVGWRNQSAEARVFLNGPNEEKISQFGPMWDTGDCNYDSNTDLRIEVPLGSGNKSTLPGHEQYFTYTVEINKTTVGGINSYKLRVNPYGYVSFVEDGSPTTSGFPTQYGFGILSANFINDPRGETSYTLRFALDCSITTDTGIWLKWSDADYGRINELNGISWELWDDTTGALIHSRANQDLMYRQSSDTWGWNTSWDPDGAQNFQADFQTEPLKPGHKYRWVWHGVDNQNGLQVWMPYPEVNFEQICGTWEYVPAISGTNSTTVVPGDIITIGGTAENIGTVKGQDYTLRIRVESWTTPDSVTITGLGGGEQASNRAVDYINQAGIAAGETSAQKTAQFTVNSNAQNGDQICFGNRIQPFSGVDATVTSTDWRDTVQTKCYVVGTDWQYSARVLTPGQAVQPLDTISIIGDAQNIGSLVGGANYLVQIFPSQGAGSVTTGVLSPDSPASPDGSWSNNKTASWNETTAIPGGGNSGDRTANYIVNAGAIDGTQICFNVRVTPVSASNSGSDIDTEQCFPVEVPERPYLEVYGADIWAGGVFADDEDYISSTCSNGTTNTPGIIRAVLPRNGIGAVGGFGLFATDEIAGIGSSRVVGGKELTFSNTDTTLGNYNTDGRCITNYYELFIADTSNTYNGVAAGIDNLNGQYKRSGNLTIDSLLTFNAGTRVILLIDGDVTIRSDIKYNDSYVAHSASDVPLFMLVVRGNINIEGGVIRLDGAYFAIPSDEANPTNGIINTCSNQPLQITIGSICDNELEINGIFTAQRVEFLRVAGGLRRGGPAEVFNVSPEIYLAVPDFTTRYFSNFTTRQFKDLPPVY